MKHLLLFMSLISFNINLAIQAPTAINPGIVSGVVLDKELQEPIPYVTIIINDLEGNLISGNISQEDGSFKIEDIPMGTYNFQAQFIGYKTYSREIEISGNKSIVNIGTISLETDIAMLDELNIIAERTTIEQKIDRKVINVGKDLTTLGPSASDIMGNLPTLTVDQDGNIAMRGNDNVRILLDGKPTNIPAAQLLKQLPSSSIKSIELITNPSAKYNPEGMSGIINIILHKNSNLGFNGNLTTGVTMGKNTRYNGSFDTNYRTGKFNFYGSLGSNFGKSENGGKIDNITNNSSENIFFLNESQSYLYKIGLDFFLDEKNTFSLYTNQNYFNGEPIGHVNILFADDPLENIFQQFYLKNKNNSGTYNFDYKRDFQKEGHNIELEIDYNLINASEQAQFEFQGAGGFMDYRDDVDDEISNTTINLDYVNPLNEKSKLELGAEARLRDSRNSYESSNQNLEDALYNYDNRIYSFYATFGQNFEKWSYQLGARLEKYDVDAILNGIKIFEDDYLTVYPTAFVSYKISEKKSFQMSFGRRVDRPGLNQVNPVREFSTPRITGVGNPELDPQFTNSVELNYTQNFEKGNLTGGVFYRTIESEINQTILLDPEDPSRLLLTYTNGGNNNASGVEFSGTYKPFKWWSLNPSLEFYTKNERGVLGTERIEVENTAFNLRLNQSFTATDNLTFQLFGYYRSPEKMLQFKAEEMYFINAGARYNIFDDKATISLNFNDIFNTQRFTFRADLPYSQRGSFKPESQTVFLGFSYKFGGGKNGAVKRKNRDDNEKDGGGLF